MASASAVFLLWMIPPWKLFEPSLAMAAVLVGVRILDRLTGFVGARVGAGEIVWFSSHFASLYPILGRRSPVWDIYPAWKADEEGQARMDRELEPVDWAILADEPAYNPGLALSKTYPRAWAMLSREFEPVPVEGLPSWIHVLRRRRTR
jgi:hypothetical protein